MWNLQVPKVNLHPGAVALTLGSTIATYTFVPYKSPSILEGILKCLPIITLMIWVVLHSKHLRDHNVEFSKKILFGLIFGCIGDYLLIWPYCFEAGIAAFAFGHIHYIRAFGFEPLNLPLGAVIYGCLTIIIIWLQFELSGILAVAIPVYSVVIGTMVWRAISRYKGRQSVAALCAAIGAICFVFSDFCIAINTFKYAVPFEAFLVMSTYYGAQIGITSSVLDLD